MLLYIVMWTWEEEGRTLISFSNTEEEVREQAEAVTTPLTYDRYSCVQVCFLSGYAVVGGASVDSGVSGCQVVHWQHQEVGELSRRKLVTAQCSIVGMGILSIIYPLPWQHCVQVFIGYTGETETSALCGLLPLDHTKASWDVWGETERRWKDVLEGKRTWGRGSMSKI